MKSPISMKRKLISDCTACTISMNLLITFLISIGVVLFCVYGSLYQAETPLLPKVYISRKSWTKRYWKNWKGSILTLSKTMNQSDIVWLHGQEFRNHRRCTLEGEENCGTLPHQSVKGIPDGGIIADKDSLNSLLYEQPEDDEFNLEYFYPKTFEIHLESERKAFISHVRNENSKNINEQSTCSSHGDGPEIWIMKPGKRAGGNGIFIIDPEKAGKFVSDLENEKYLRRRKIVSQKYIAQRYLANPLLYENKKMSHRVFFLVLSLDPLLVLGYDDFFVLLARHNYTNDNFDNITKHTTNRFQQVKNKNKTENNMAQFLSREEFRMFMEKRHSSSSFSELWSKSFMNDSFSIISHISKKFREKVMGAEESKKYYNHHHHSDDNNIKNTRGKYPHFFGLYCLDLMIDKDLKVWLHEINQQCSLRIEPDEAKRRVLVPLGQSMLPIIDEFRRKRNDDNIVSSVDLMNLRSDLKNWKWVVKGEEDFPPDLYAGTCTNTELE